MSDNDTCRHGLPARDCPCGDNVQIVLGGESLFVTTAAAKEYEELLHRGSLTAVAVGVAIMILIGGLLLPIIIWLFRWAFGLV